MDDRSTQLDLITASSGSMVPFAKGASEAAKKSPARAGLGGGAGKARLALGGKK
jgi:hypothetical protein